MRKIGAKIERLKSIIETLRGPDGCPWDRKQTPQSFKSYLLEEVHELLEAIDQDEASLVREEIGDMLFQLLFVSQLYEEAGRFHVNDALDAISDKMIRRHPHVFGDETVDSELEQKKSWNRIKAGEKERHRTMSELLAAVPKSFPALRRAQRIGERAAHNGFDWPGSAGAALALFRQEADALEAALGAGEPDQIAASLGETLLALTAVGRAAGINGEDSLHGAIARFLRRCAALEKAATRPGRNLTDIAPDELRRLWEETKNVSDDH